jgi:hypothetical protein
MSDTYDVLETLHGDEKIVREAKTRLEYCSNREGECRKLFLEDIKFANADSNNGYQWPNDIQTNRNREKRPCLTINKTHQHNLQIINDAKQNKASIKIRPVGNESTYEAAEVYEGIIRHIEYISNASDAYDTGVKFQVEGGIGYWRVVTDYIGDDTFDQEIYIRRIKDPLSVFLDPDINEIDGSDAMFGFVFTDMKREMAREKYPKFKDMMGQNALGNSDNWIDDHHVRVCEYFRRVKKTDRLITFQHPDTGIQHTMRESKLPPKIAKAVIDDPISQCRGIEDYEVEWFLFIGNEIADRRIWPGTTIPLVRCIGEETIIDGKIDRKGHTRAMKDPQRIYNYWSSSAVEFVALQGKTPFVGAAAAIEGNETYWREANVQNFSILPYKHVDDDGNPIPPPTRAEAPVFAPAYVQGMQVAQAEMAMVSGQYEATFGEKSNERSGRAINERARQGDRATYHFIDNQAIAIRRTGKIIIELIPKIYDTKREINILANDGVPSRVTIDPEAKQSYLIKRKQEAEEVAQIMINPNIGRYDVQADVGPAYATRRQEAFNALSQILSQSSELVPLVGDLLFKAADFPMAEEVAERLERMVPPQAKGEGMTPAVQQMQMQLKQMQGSIAALIGQLAEEKSKVKAKDQQKEIDVYEAITKRIEVLLKNVIVTPKDNATMLHDLMVEEHASGLRQVEAAAPFQKLLNEKLKAQKPVKKVSVFKPSGKM